MNNQNKIVYIDLLRIFASLSVVFIHVSSIHLEDLPIQSWDWMFHNIYCSLSRWSVPMFIMISGALFLDSNKIIKLKTFFNKNILRIATAIITWSFIFAIYQFLTVDRYHQLSSIVGLSIIGHYHLWFLYLILGIYLTIPIFKLVSKNRIIIRYYLIISFIITFILPAAIEIIKVIIPQNIFLIFNSHPYFIKALQLNYNFLIPQLYFGYSFYFLLGHYLSTENLRINKVALTSLGMTSMIMIIIGTYIESKNQNLFSGTFYHYLNIFPLLSAISVFLLFKSYSGNKSYSFFENLSKTSFGTYLIHPMIIETLLLFKVDTMTFHPLLGIPLFAIFIYIVSTFISYLLSKIPIFNKYCI